MRMGKEHRAAMWPLLAGAVAVGLVLGVTALKRPAVATKGPSLPIEPAHRSDTSKASPSIHASPALKPRFSLAERQERRLAMQAEQVRKGQASHQALASRYESERVDPPWASATEAKLLAASASAEIRRVGAMPGNYRASCRSTTCRIGADFPDKGAMEDWLSLFSTGSDGALPFEAYVVARNPDGTFHLDVMALAKR